MLAAYCVPDIVEFGCIRRNTVSPPFHPPRHRYVFKLVIVLEASHLFPVSIHTEARGTGAISWKRGRIHDSSLTLTLVSRQVQICG